MLVCERCIERAKDDDEFKCERNSFSALSEFMNFLVSDDVDLSSMRNIELVSFIMHRLAILQSPALDEEVQAELRTPKTHMTLRQNRQEVDFLSNDGRNIVLLRTLLGFSKLNHDTKFDSLPRKKNLCSLHLV